MLRRYRTEWGETVVVDDFDASGPDGPMPPLTVGRVLGRGVKLQCPVCGGRGLFSRWFAMVEHCPTCGFRFHRVEGHWIGSLGMNTIVSFGALLLAVIVGVAVTMPDPPAGTLIAVTVAVAAITPIVFFPWSRTLWSAIDLLMRPLEPDDDVDPRWWPAASPRHRR